MINLINDSAALNIHRELEGDFSLPTIQTLQAQSLLVFGRQRAAGPSKEVHSSQAATPKLLCCGFEFFLPSAPTALWSPVCG
jgi:hypothetical protein